MWAVPRTDRNFPAQVLVVGGVGSGPYVLSKDVLLRREGQKRNDPHKLHSATATAAVSHLDAPTHAVCI